MIVHFLVPRMFPSSLYADAYTATGSTFSFNDHVWCFLLENNAEIKEYEAAWSQGVVN